jgi:hypothetical protein
MGATAFDPCQVEYGGKRAPGMRITCGRCGKSDSLHFNSLKLGVDPDKIIRRKFAERGWFVADRSYLHRCPGCSRVAKLVATSMKDMKPMANIVPMKADPPAQMTREDRRVIFEKLNDVYGDEKSGYTGKWTDKSVATDLGIPWAWVSQVREEMFGSLGANAEIEATTMQAVALLSEIEIAVQKLRALQEEGKNIQARFSAAAIESVGKLTAEAERISRNIKRIDQAR